MVNPQETDQQVMMKRLWKSDELIKQLKHIIKAQHGKIEELRERLEYQPTPIVATHMVAQDVTDLARVKDDNEELRRQVYRTKAEMLKHKNENETLRKANSRLKRMLQQEEGTGSLPLPSLSQREENDDSTGLLDLGSSDAQCSAASAALVKNTSRAGTAPALPSTARGAITALPSTARGAPKRPMTTGSAGPTAGLAPFSKLWRLSSLVPTFWRDLDHPASVLTALVEVAGRLFEDGPSTCITVYLLDNWIRSASTAPGTEPSLFYLGAGRSTVQVFHTDAARPEPPRFGDMQALPMRTRNALAVTVQMPISHRKLALVQVVSTEEPGKKTKQFTPKELQDKVSPQQLPENQACFTDSHLMYLQLVCNVAGGVLHQLKEIEGKHRLLEKMRSCVDVSVAINQARTLPDFEQRVKHMLGNFFSVSTVRVLFFDDTTNELLISAAQMKRTWVTKLSLEKGVVGLCAKRMAVVNVGNISHHPYIDAASDGLQRSGRPVSSEASMLVGPLVVDNVEEPKLVGVVQLLERRRHKAVAGEKGRGDGHGEEFSSEEQTLFAQMLRVCAQAAWRTFKVQELTAQLSGSPATLESMLASTVQA